MASPASGDVAVDPSRGLLYVSSSDDGRVWRAKISLPGLVDEVTGPVARRKTLAVRPGDNGAVAYLHRRRCADLRPRLQTGAFPTAANLGAQDSAFTRNGKGLRGARAPEGGGSEIVVYSSADLVEVARLPVGSLARPCRVARASARLVANAGAARDGGRRPGAAHALRVQPGALLRDRAALRGAGLGGAPARRHHRRHRDLPLPARPLQQSAADGDGHVPGEEGVRAGGRRRRRAARLRTATAAAAASASASAAGGTPGGPRAHGPPLRCRGDRHLAGAANHATAPVAGDRVELTQAIAFGSVTLSPANSATFTVEGREGLVAGALMPPFGGQSITWATQPLVPGLYALRLYGTEDALGRGAIRGTNGLRLDGEPMTLPSGDGTQGGNFVLEFEIVG